MSELIESDAAAVALARLDAAVDDLLTLNLDPFTDDDVLAVWHRLETVRRRLAGVDHTVITEVSTRRLDFTHGARSVASLARQLLRIGIGEARARVSAAEAAGPRRAMTGEVLAPSYQRVAAEQASGSISPTHARVVVTAIEALPEAVQAIEGEAVEAFLVEQAHIFDPDTLTKLARRLADTFDPDGQLKDVAYRDRMRDLRAHRRSDGSGRIEGELTAEAMEHVLTLLDTLARPVPERGGRKDLRTPGKRRHDALLTACKLVERTNELPDAGGLTATVILTINADDYAHCTGFATTGHGATIPMPEAKRWISGDTRVIGVVLDRMKRVVAYSSSHRIFTQAQRLTMIARDHGCSFSGCDAPAQQCEAHHIVDHASGGPTSIHNGALVCTVHHREHRKMGWTGTMINNIPHWIPPPWIDPEQQPRRNEMHDPAAALISR